MKDQLRTREQLNKELLELSQKHEVLKNLHEKDLPERKHALEKLIASETHYRSLFESARNGVLSIDAESGKILSVNPFLIQMLGYSPEQFIDKVIWEIGFFKDIIAVQDRFSEIKQKKYVRYEDLPLETADGRRIKVEFDSQVYLVDNKELIQCNIRDITERKQAEQALRDSNEKFSTVFQTSPYAITISDAENGNFVEINDAFVSITGFTREEAIGNNSTKMGLWGDSEVRKKVVSDLKEGKEVKGKEYQFRIKNGEIITGLFSAQTIQLNGQPYILSSIHNMTARKQAEEALRKSEEKYRTLFENVQDVFYQTDLNGIILEISPSIRDYSEFSREDLIGMPVSKIYYNPDDRIELVKAIMKTGELRDYELRLKSRTVPIAYVSINARLIFDTGGRPDHINGALRNITERKRVEQELVKSKEHAEESDRLKSAFLANMSHEIRTPMNGILGFAELLKEPDITGEEHKKYISIIEKSGARLLNIINNIISISKVESGQMEITISETNVNQQIKHLYDFFKPEAEQKGIRFLFKNSLPAKAAIIKTDKEKVYAILTNLIKNAIKFTTQGSIEFGYEKKDHDLEFFVKDSGGGIRGELKEIIFERFRQGNESLNRNYEGAGLGLTISKAFVEMLGGKIRIESEEGIGSTFYFTIPYIT